jgi:hypothetical protein
MQGLNSIVCVILIYKLTFFQPGDRVQVVGVYRCLPGKKGGFTNVSFRYVNFNRGFLF